MVAKDDWRLDGQESHLKDIPLYFIPFRPLSKEWDHEHCEFCWDKFYLHEGYLQEGYCTKPRNERSARWICPECYEDFKEMFGLVMSIFGLPIGIIGWKATQRMVEMRVFTKVWAVVNMISGVFMIGVLFFIVVCFFCLALS